MSDTFIITRCHQINVTHCAININCPWTQEWCVHAMMRLGAGFTNDQIVQHLDQGDESISSIIAIECKTKILAFDSNTTAAQQAF